MTDKGANCAFSLLQPRSKYAVACRLVWLLYCFINGLFHLSYLWSNPIGYLCWQNTHSAGVNRFMAVANTTAPVNVTWLLLQAVGSVQKQTLNGGQEQVRQRGLGTEAEGWNGAGRVWSREEGRLGSRLGSVWQQWYQILTPLPGRIHLYVCAYVFLLLLHHAEMPHGNPEASIQKHDGSRRGGRRSTL